MTWIANGESGSSVRAKLNALMVPISSVTIADPVEYIDIALPSGYRPPFSLEVIGLSFSEGTHPSFAVSTDGGLSFFNDPINNDSYQCPNFGVRSLLVLSSVAGPTLSVDFKIWLFPGSVLTLPTMFALDASFHNSGDPSDLPQYEFYPFIGVPSPVATTPFVRSRINLLRLLPFGNGDVPPTSEVTLTADAITLLGAPAP